MTTENARISTPHSDWRVWGPYLSERQWGTVREDYSEHGEAWEFLDHEASRKHAYRWGEDGIGGYSDDKQTLCFSLGMWNGKDTILKERLYGLTGNEGNHGEDVKEHYYYLDGTPSHSYLKMLYKYPQREFPYADLANTNRSAGKDKDEYELLDTGVFDDDRYFDVFIEYVKASEFDTLIRITVFNRGPDAADLDLLANLLFRNTWSWGRGDGVKPSISLQDDGGVLAEHPQLGSYCFCSRSDAEFLFTENETNPDMFNMESTGFHKDAFHAYVVNGKTKAVNPDKTGTKCAARLKASIGAGDSKSFDLRLFRDDGVVQKPFGGFDELFDNGKSEADEYFAGLQKDIEGEDKRRVHRQAIAGLIWTKQFYNFNIRQWLEGDPAQPTPPASRKNGRNHEWAHLDNADIISMPDKWEYPWYAAWDLSLIHI